RAERDLDKPLVDRKVRRLEIERRAHDLHGRARASERARDKAELGRRLAVAGEQIAQYLAAARGLRPPFGIERHIVAALQPLLHIPIGEAVADVVDRRRRHGDACAARAYSFATLISGASGCFMPTM